MRRLALALLLVLSLLFGATPAWADVGARDLPDVGSASAPGSASARVRTGVTELSGPSAQEREPPPLSDPDDIGSPGDAPRVTATLKMPSVPKGFSTFDEGWIKFSYHPSSRDRVEPIIAQAEAMRRELRARLGQDVLANVRVDIARTPGEMEGFAPEGAPYPSYASGVAYPELGLVLLTLTPRYPGADHDVAEIFKHELAHVALHDAVLGKAVPRWFNEGFAVLASGETSFKRLYTLWTATLADNILPLREVERTFPSDEMHAQVAYAQAVDLVRFMIRDQEEHRFHALVAELRDGNPLDISVRDSYGVDLNTLEHEWREDIAKRYTFWPILFSGSAVWACILGLAVWGWKRRRRKAKITLDRWAKEEAIEDAVRLRRARQDNQPRIHIVLSRNALPANTPIPTGAEAPEVPKVQHDGQWHTLH